MSIRNLWTITKVHNYSTRFLCFADRAIFITLANDKFDAQIFNTFITILYTYMFRAISCSSSGGQIVLIQHLISSLPVIDHPFCPICHQLSLSYNSQHLKISFYFFSPSFPGSSSSSRPFHFLSEDLFGHPVLLHSLQVTQPTYSLPLYPFYYIFSAFHLNLCTGRSLTEGDDIRCCINPLNPN